LPFKKNYFKKRIDPLFTKLDKILEARRRGEPEPSQEKTFGVDVWKAVNAYPENTDNLLPTKLGNVMRAYERYSDVVYNIEAIVVSTRLFTIIPEEARNRVRESESLLNFSLNLLVSGVVTLMLYGAMVVVYLYNGNADRLSDALPWPVIPAISALSGWFGWWQLPSAAAQRGEQIKAIFDLYRGRLAEALGLELPSTHQAERDMWDLVSRRMSFRLAKDWKSLDEFRKTKEDKEKNKNNEEDKKKENKKDEEDEEDDDEEDEREDAKTGEDNVNPKDKYKLE
jgi:hypothetical protein